MVTVSSAARTRPVVRPEYHSSPSKVLDAGFNHGSGIMRPPGSPPAKLGYWVDMMANPNAKPVGRVKVNEKTKTVTVTVDTVTDRLTLPADKKKTLVIDAPRPKTINADYKLVVKDTKGHTLFHTSFRNIIPC